VIKPEYASPEISGKENDVDIFYIVQIPWRNQIHQNKHKGSPSIVCINVNEHHKKFDKLKNYLPAAPNSNDVNDGIWPAWALPNDYDNTKLDFKPDN
ncbi:15875_t:CDS:2, partial [Cetraspora pellucida]